MKRAFLVFGALAVAFLTVGASCKFTIPPPPGSATATATATVHPTASAPVPTAAPVATATPRPTIDSQCTDDRDPAHSVFVNRVRAAMRQYQAEHPEKFDGDFFTFPDSQDVFFNGIIAHLAERNLDGYIDVRGGDLIVASHDTPIGAGFAETYHPISSWDPDRQSGRLVQSAPFIGRCVPRWF